MAASDKRELTHQLTTSRSGYELVVSPLLLALFGYWVDGLLGWRPVLTITLAVLGLAGAIASLVIDYQGRMGKATAVATSVLGEQAAERVAARDAKAGELAAEREALEAELAIAEAAAPVRTGGRVQ